MSARHGHGRSSRVVGGPVSLGVVSSMLASSAGRVTGLAVDRGAIVTDPLYGDLTATATTPHATVSTVVLAPTA